MTLVETSRPLNARVWQREEHDHYVEEPWCSMRLFQEESFSGSILDPACGFGTIVKAAQALGLPAAGSDIVDRGGSLVPPIDFFEVRTHVANIVTNVPFGIVTQFTQHALSLALQKVAVIFPTQRLNAAHWLQELPLRRIWLMTPRPSMPPGYVIAAGGKRGGGRADFCWLVFHQGYQGVPEVRWLRRNET